MSTEAWTAVPRETLMDARTETWTTVRTDTWTPDTDTEHNTQEHEHVGSTKQWCDSGGTPIGGQPKRLQRESMSWLRGLRWARWLTGIRGYA